MPKQSAGILLYRQGTGGPEFFLVHPGGPFWAKKDLNSWSVPKGEFPEDEDPLSAAKREFEEETGFILSGGFMELSPVRLKSGKKVYCFAIEGDIEPAAIKSNTFEMEWPPKSGSRQSFPEVDKAAWFDRETAVTKINESQAAFIEELLTLIKR
ncbi:MAG: NUDIX domain-containing protein [Chloroflexota bacterium]